MAPGGLHRSRHLGTGDQAGSRAGSRDDRSVRRIRLGDLIGVIDGGEAGERDVVAGRCRQSGRLGQGRSVREGGDGSGAVEGEFREV